MKKLRLSGAKVFLKATKVSGGPFAILGQGPSPNSLTGREPALARRVPPKGTSSEDAVQLVAVLWTAVDAGAPGPGLERH